MLMPPLVRTWWEGEGPIWMILELTMPVTCLGAFQRMMADLKLTIYRVGGRSGERGKGEGQEGRGKEKT